MKRFTRKFLYLSLGIFVPFLYLLSPSWLSITGVGPNWALLWLLPWAIEKGPSSGLFAGLCLGMVMDGIVLDGATYIPSLMLIGYWWGRIGIKGPVIEKSFNFGLLLWIGCLINGISLWIQQIFSFNMDVIFLFNARTFHTLLAQAIITSLLAPIFSSWALLSFFRKKSL